MSVVFDTTGLERCIHCGLCLEACPTYKITQLETESPRGRLHLMGAIADGRIDPLSSDATLLHLDRCLACRACEAVCPSGVPYGRLIEETRAGITQERGINPLGQLLLWSVSRPWVLRAMAALLLISERSGLRNLARRFLSPRLRRLDALAPPVGRPAYRRVAVGSPHSSVALLLGCVMRASYGDVHTATARVLAHLGIEVIDTPGQTCCGALHAHAGDKAEAVRLAKLNIAAFERADVILVNAAGCGAHLKSYAHLLEDRPNWADRAVALASRVRDVSEYMQTIVGDKTFGDLGMRVTYQDPCHLAHAQGIRAEPRALLSKVRGLELVEMAGADICCGSAGYYNLAQPEYADRLLEPKIDAILATRPDAVVTGNPGCMLQIAAGLRSRGRGDIPVLHIVEVLDRALSARCGRRTLTIFLATVATVAAVLALLLIPVSITLGRYANVLGEVIVLVACVGYVTRVMRADRRKRREAEAQLPPERRAPRREPRRPITFQFRETLFAFLVWFVLVVAFNAFVVGIGPVPNVGIAIFAAFMLATLTITGRHMMFRLTAEEDSDRGASSPGPRLD